MDNEEDVRVLLGIPATKEEIDELEIDLPLNQLGGRPVS